MELTVADELAKKQKQISVAEFFESNKQILGFDSPTRALLTACKEAVDNALDACEEARILPELDVEIKPVPGTKDEFILIVEDNGPGIVKRQIAPVFAQLLYGSRFHAVRQSRGQQGIGVSAAVLYGQLTTGKHTFVTSKIGKGRPALRLEVAIDTKNNRPETVSESLDSWEKPHGTRVEIPLTGRYTRGRQSPWEYIRSTAIVNPHLRLTFTEPDGRTHRFEPAAAELPPPTREIKPHPQGIELGTLMRMARSFHGRRLSAFLQKEFSSMGTRTVKEVLKIAGLNASDRPAELSREDAKSLLNAFTKAKIMGPPVDCLSPIGETLVKRGLRKQTLDVSPEFIVSATRPPAVNSGHPFQVEVGIVFGGSLAKEDSVRILRYANRVPLLYQQGACAMTRAVEAIDWRRYGLDQRGGRGIPVGAAIFLLHIAATKVPFTSEAKEAVAEIEGIVNEVKLALRDCARHMSRHLRRQAKRAKAREKFILISKILPQIAEKSASMLNKPVPKIDRIVCEIMNLVWIEDEVEYESMMPAAAVGGASAKRRRSSKGSKTLGDFDQTPEASPPQQRWMAKATISIHNFTQRRRKLRLFALVPPNGVVAQTNPTATRVRDTHIEWSLPALAPAEQRIVEFSVAGIDKGEFDEAEVFVEGMGDLRVVGADPWRGTEGVLADSEPDTPALPDSPLEDALTEEA